MLSSANASDELELEVQIPCWSCRLQLTLAVLQLSRVRAHASKLEQETEELKAALLKQSPHVSRGNQELEEAQRVMAEYKSRCASLRKEYKSEADALTAAQHTEDVRVLRILQSMPLRGPAAAVWHVLQDWQAAKPGSHQVLGEAEALVAERHRMSTLQALQMRTVLAQRSRDLTKSCARAVLEWNRKFKMEYAMNLLSGYGYTSHV